MGLVPVKLVFIARVILVGVMTVLLSLITLVLFLSLLVTVLFLGVTFPIWSYSYFRPVTCYLGHI